MKHSLLFFLGLSLLFLVLIIFAPRMARSAISPMFEARSSLACVSSSRLYI
jgi:hypothetical protein